MVDGGGCKMANPFHSTGSPIVDRMCRLQFTGNVIPAAWYRTITRDNGKPNLTAIIICQMLCIGIGRWKSEMN